MVFKLRLWATLTTFFRVTWRRPYRFWYDWKKILRNLRRLLTVEANLVTFDPICLPVFPFLSDRTGSHVSHRFVWREEQVTWSNETLNSVSTMSTSSLRTSCSCCLPGWQHLRNNRWKRVSLRCFWCCERLAGPSRPAAPVRIHRGCVSN